MELQKKLLPLNERRAKPEQGQTLGFGRIFSDHMLVMRYNEKNGWHNATIEPYAPISMDPASLVLHYGQGVFEGMKAYRNKKGEISMFRPEQNIKRLNDSCERLCIPTLPFDDVMSALYELIRVEQEWIPSEEGTSLYIRPTVIATEACLGVKVSAEYIFYVIVGPVGAYYPEGFNPVKIWVEEEYIRAAPGGLGAAKTMANYAHSLLATKKAKARGYTQVLWLDACDKKTIEEVGTMNLFFKINGEVITAPLGGSILPGITRDAVLKLCARWSIPVQERRITIDEISQAHAAGTLEEVFGTGTAAVISPVGLFHYRGQDYNVGQGIGPLSLKLYQAITQIQLGEVDDPFDWVVRLD